VKISITPASATSAAPLPATSDTPDRTTPPPPTSTGSTASADSSSATTPPSSATAGPPNGGYDPFLQAAFSDPYKNSPVQTSTQTSTKSTAPLDPVQAFDDAYWAKQPPAVQALRNMQDPAQRTSLATQLAHEGYSIDVPIMVWGWDPSLTTSMRQADGYTWVPSALQNPIELAPGLPAMGGLAAYDPKNPPSGSIAV
jgi:hypothetical protein